MFQVDYSMMCYMQCFSLVIVQSSLCSVSRLIMALSGMGSVFRLVIVLSVLRLLFCYRLKLYIYE